MLELKFQVFVLIKKPIPHIPLQPPPIVNRNYHASSSALRYRSQMGGGTEFCISQTFVYPPSPTPGLQGGQIHFTGDARGGGATVFAWPQNNTLYFACITKFQSNPKLKSPYDSLDPLLPLTKNVYLQKLGETDQEWLRCAPTTLTSPANQICLSGETRGGGGRNDANKVRFDYEILLYVNLSQWILF